VLCLREASEASSVVTGSTVSDASGCAPVADPTATRETAPATHASGATRGRQLNIAIPPALLFLPLAALAIYWAKSEMLALEQSRLQPSPELTASSGPAGDAPPRRLDAPTEPSRTGAAPVPATSKPGSRVEAAPGAISEPAVSDRADAARERQREKQQRADELAAARELVNVTVYYAEWCPACRTTRAYLRERGIAAEEHDVDKDSRARSRQRLLNPRGSIPTIDIEGQVLVGFNASKIEHAISRAAQARLERDGR
jgi:glutaredoxin 3